MGSGVAAWLRRTPMRTLIVLSVAVVAVACVIALMVIATKRHYGGDAEGWARGTLEGASLAAMLSFYDGGMALFAPLTSFHYYHGDQWLLFVVTVFVLDGFALLYVVGRAFKRRGYILLLRLLLIETVVLVVGVPTALPPPEYGAMRFTVFWQSALYVEPLTALRTTIAIDAWRACADSLTAVRVARRVVVITALFIQCVALLTARVAYTSAILCALALGASLYPAVPAMMEALQHQPLPTVAAAAAAEEVEMVSDEDDEEEEEEAAASPSTQAAPTAASSQSQAETGTA